MGRKPKTILAELPLPQVKPDRPKPATGLPPLEERTCVCGCGIKFKVVATSLQVYGSRRCDPKAENAWGKVAKAQVEKILMKIGDDEPPEN